MNRQKRSDLDFQLAYLVLLTRSGLKPLSRWEGPLDKAARATIRDRGLALRTVRRRTRSGRPRSENVFARDGRWADLYARRCEGTLLSQTPSSVRWEGQIFGYPSCCVESFVQQPYRPNGLRSADQEILFHWACRGCSATPGLLREYRRVHDECRRIFRGRDRSGIVHRPRAAHAGPMRTVRARNRLGTSLWSRAAARFAASLALIAGTASAAVADDPHWLPVADDIDQDFLTFAEEVMRGTDWYHDDTDQSGELDGVQTAQLLHELLATPPPGVTIDEYPMWGSEICSVCGAWINMGYVVVRHEQRDLAVVLPYIALHYLEHGGLAYAGDLHTGRVDLEALKRILFPCDPPHLLPTHEPDADADGLTDREEPLLGSDPELPDTDGDSLADGPQVAESLLPLIAGLPREVVPDRPYMQEGLMDGVEQCEVCGVTFNMGFAELVNPLEELSVAVPFVALHTLAHGGFVFDGTYNEGRLLPTVLRTVLTAEGTAHWLPVVGDSDGDGLTDDEELYMGMEPEDPDEDNNGIPDGRDLAQTMGDRVHALPQGPLPDEIYAIDHLTFGLYNCLVCGEAINMGFREVVNPLRDLTVDVSFYNLHFMQHGSFATDREDVYPRADVRAIAAALEIQPTAVTPGPAASFALWNAPNPLSAGGKTTIVLALPREGGEVAVAIYDPAGRRVRDLYRGPVTERITRFIWDGRSRDGGLAAAGTYLCRVETCGITLTRKIVVLR